MDMTALFFSTALALVAGMQNPAELQAEPQSTDATREAVPLPEAQAIEPRLHDTAVDSAAMSLQTYAMRAQAWLNGLDTLQARFEQVDSAGQSTTGLLQIDRPGRARFDYDDPNPVLVVADGSTVAIADFQLETLDRVPIGATPLRFLLNENLDLVGSGAAIDAGHYDGRLYVSLEDPDGEVEGRLILIFEDPEPSAPFEAMELAGWQAIDVMGGLTEVRLNDIETGQRISARQFILDDEDVMGGDDRRRRRGR